VEEFLQISFESEELSKMFDLVIFPYHDWRKYEREGARGRDLHLIKGFIEHSQVNKILMINRPCSLAEIVKNGVKKFPEYGLEIESNDDYRLSKISDKMYTLDFFVKDIVGPILMRRRWWANILCKRNIEKIISNTINKYLNKPLCIAFNPFAYKIIKKLDFKKIVYDIFDDFSEHPRLNTIEKKTAAKGMEFLIQSANTIVTVSEEFKEKVSHHSNVNIILNGFSSNFLSSIEGEKPNDLMKINNPIIGYSGRISKRIDVRLIKELVEHFRDVNFVFIGEIYDKSWISPLNNYQNVHFLGAKRNEDLPNYFQFFDVAIVPHFVNNFEKAGNSIKVFEYLAAGVPVVSTNIGGLDEFKHVVDICLDTKQFKSSIRKYLDNKMSRSKENKEKRKATVAVHTWESKATDFVKIIEEIY
jgi:teichuronic acid biosynthesis glycosyltransferase TuaH